jgi:nitric oxide synthase oxygenase domain/subunit
VLNFAEKEQF